ncbi:hypothetical protein Tco_0957360 [Tanacetum coccineum]
MMCAHRTCNPLVLPWDVPPHLPAPSVLLTVPHQPQPNPLRSPPRSSPNNTATHRLSPLGAISRPPIPHVLTPLAPFPRSDSWKTARWMPIERLRDDLRMRETDGDYKDAGGRSQEAEAAHKGTEADKETSDSDGRGMINQGVTAALAARDANTNGVDSHPIQEQVLGETSEPLMSALTRLHEVPTSKFQSTEGVVVLTQWIVGKWKLTIGNDIAYAMTWTELKNKMTDKYYPRTEIKKLEVGLWELKVKEIGKYVGGLPDMIHGSVVASKPKTVQEATKMAIKVMDKRIRTFAERQTESKRKFEDTSRNSQNQQQ